MNFTENELLAMLDDAYKLIDEIYELKAIRKNESNKAKRSEINQEILLKWREVEIIEETITENGGYFPRFQFFMRYIGIEEGK